MADKAFVVVGGEGMYEDYESWEVAAYLDRDEALEHVKRLEAHARALRERWEDYDTWVAAGEPHLGLLMGDLDSHWEASDFSERQVLDAVYGISEVQLRETVPDLPVPEGS